MLTTPHTRQLLLLALAFCCFVAGIFAPAGHAEEGTPPKLDFVGGYFKDGVYHCYREPCFTIHRNAYPTKNNINFKLTDWPHWLDLDGNCQNEDLQTLYRESQTEPEYGEDDPCETIHSGSWIDPYTGQNIEEAWLMAVDHRISLQEAHLYGATAWPRKKRALFANAPDNLVAVSAKAQQERAYRGAKDWLPDNQQYWCEYVVHRERVAHMFELYFPPEEQAVHARIKQLYCKY